MSFKRFDPEDIVLSSELITFPTWYTQEEGDTSHVDMSVVVSKNEDQGPGIDFYTDYYSGYKTGSEYIYDSTHSKALFSLAYAERPDRNGSYTPDPNSANIVFGQYRSLVLGDEDSEFRFGNTRIDADSVSGSSQGADAFIALTVDRARFREKLDPSTCTLNFESSSIYIPSEATGSVGATASIAPDTNSSRRYLDAGRVFDLALRVVEASESGSSSTVRFVYPDIDNAKTSYGYFLPDIGVVLFNLSNSGSLFRSKDNSEDSALAWKNRSNKVETFLSKMDSIDLRSQETVTSNFVFVRARNAEFNYSTNPSNITGSAGNLRHDIMINQPQSFITTVGLYNDSNDLLAVAKLSRPLIKDFTKEALIRIKLDY